MNKAKIFSFMVLMLSSYYYAGSGTFVSKTIGMKELSSHYVLENSFNSCSSVILDNMNSSDGTGGIYDLPTYVNEKYGSNYALRVKYTLGVSLMTIDEMYNAGQQFTVGNDVTTSSNSCSITAIAKEMYYLSCNFSSYHINYVLPAIYDLTWTRANDSSIFYSAINMGPAYTPTQGTDPTMIDDIIENMFVYFGTPSVNSTNYYSTSLSYIVDDEIDHNFPVILNIGNGYYYNHSVVINGYAEYGFGTDEHWFIGVSDGWNESQAWIDWDCFPSIYSLTATTF